jgi:tetratricopeptide (TPR) repeat protein
VAVFFREKHTSFYDKMTAVQTSIDPEKAKAEFELKHIQDPSNLEAVHFLATWHLERHNYQQARQYFHHLCGIKNSDPSIWLCLSISCAFAKEFQESQDAALMASQYLEYREEDARVLFCSGCHYSLFFLFLPGIYFHCTGLLLEIRKDYNSAYNTFMRCLLKCDALIASNRTFANQSAFFSPLNSSFELRGEVLLRIAIIHKDIGATEDAMSLCDRICGDVSTMCLSTSIGTRSLCLKVRLFLDILLFVYIISWQGLLHEIRSEFPLAEVMYRSALQLIPGHALALERLGRLYLRFRETIPAAVQCFLKVNR